jgi:pimeloyl-[acyl-carrier protein] methyl ester esterase
MTPLAFLHGWAQSQQIWFQQRADFADALFLNLPGHGGAADAPGDHWAQQLADKLPDEPCLLVGWSLGGILALQIARLFPHRIAALALVSTTPCFRIRPDWPSGCDDQLFAAFEEAVTSGSARLLNRFFTLMLHGDALSRSDYNALARAAVDRAHPPSSQGLRCGLELLGALDLRHAIAGLAAPTLLLHGEQDAVVSIQSARWLAERMGESRLKLFPDCGHAPFLTHPAAFNTALSNWRQTL